MEGGNGAGGVWRWTATPSGDINPDAAVEKQFSTGMLNIFPREKWDAEELKWGLNWGHI